MKKRTSSEEHSIRRDSRNFQRGYVAKSKQNEEDLYYVLGEQLRLAHFDQYVSDFISADNNDELKESATNLFYFLMDSKNEKLVKNEYGLDTNWLSGSILHHIIYGKEPYFLPNILNELNKVPEFAKKIQAKENKLHVHTTTLQGVMLSETDQIPRSHV